MRVGVPCEGEGAVCGWGTVCGWGYRVRVEVLCEGGSAV